MNVHEYCPGNGTRYEVGLCATDDDRSLFMWLNPPSRLPICIDVTGCSTLSWRWFSGQCTAQVLISDVAALLGWIGKTQNVHITLPPSFDEDGKYVG